MQKWEYILVHVHFHSQTGVILTIHLNGVDNTASWINQTIFDVLNNLGREGWELAGSSLPATGGNYDLFFKRPAE